MIPEGRAGEGRGPYFYTYSYTLICGSMEEKRIRVECKSKCKSKGKRPAERDLEQGGESDQ